MSAAKTLLFLFAIYSLFPKLNVAGSIPVSRSRFLICYAETALRLLPERRFSYGW
jgi:hypothetical protein